MLVLVLVLAVAQIAFQELVKAMAMVMVMVMAKLLEVTRQVSDWWLAVVQKYAMAQA